MFHLTGTTFTNRGSDCKQSVCGPKSQVFLMLSYCSPCIMENKECQNLKNKTHLKPISNTRITNTTRCTFFLISECIFFFTFIYLFFIFYFILSLLCIFIQTDFGHFHLMLLHTSALQHLNGKYSTFYYITIILFFTLRFSMFV